MMLDEYRYMSSPNDKGDKDILMFLAKADEPHLVDAFMRTLMYAAELKGEVAALRQRLLEQPNDNTELTTKESE